jgi:hypothetical protein
LDFYSPIEPWLTQLIHRYGLEQIVRVHGLQARQTVLRAERRANRLIVLSWDGPTAEGVVPGKLFEYFGARRPILAIGGPPVCEIERLLEITGAGVRCRTVPEIQGEILKALSEHRNSKAGAIPESAVQEYRGERCAAMFAQVLDSVVQWRAMR